MACLANLSERLETHIALRKHEIHTVILPHFGHPDLSLLREAARLLTNMASVHENQPPIVVGGGLGAFVKACRREDALATRFGALGLLNICTLVDNHREVIFTK